jgi:hypothetical protein
MARLGIDSTIMIGATARRSKRAGIASNPADSSLSVCGNPMVDLEIEIECRSNGFDRQKLHPIFVSS